MLGATAIAGLLAVGAPAASATSWSPSTYKMPIALTGDVSIQNGPAAAPNQRINCSNFTLRSETFPPSGGKAYMSFPAGSINNCVNEGTGASGTFKLEATAQANVAAGAFSLGFVRNPLWSYNSMLGLFQQGSGTAGTYAFASSWTNGAGATPSTITLNNTPIGSGKYMTGTLAVTQYPSGGLVTLNP